MKAKGRSKLSAKPSTGGAEQHVRPLVRNLHGYTPGEQPKIPGLIKLNTNENPYPPAPGVLAAIRKAVDARLRLYPNPTAQPLREALARLHGCSPENILVGNGSDEVLALMTRAFVEPVPEAESGDIASAPSRSVVQYLSPCYSLYPVLARIHGAAINAVPLGRGFALPSSASLKAGGKWKFDAALTLITTPNAPTGRGYSTADLSRLCRAQHGLVVLDEAYVDFATEHSMALALKHSNVLVARTFSKAYSLCFQRIGYAVGHADLIAAMDKIRDSYNVNGLGQVAALATLSELPHYQKQFKRIIATRSRLARELTHLGFRVLPSSTNFLLVRPPRGSAEKWLGWLRDRKILVRWFSAPEISDFLRITIGTDREADAVVKASRQILREAGRQE